MQKLRFQRRVKTLIKRKEEVFKSYFLLNLQRIFLYELQRPKPVFLRWYLSEWCTIMSGTMWWSSLTQIWQRIITRWVRRKQVKTSMRAFELMMLIPRFNNALRRNPNARLIWKYSKISLTSWMSIKETSSRKPDSKEADSSEIKTESGMTDTRLQAMSKLSWWT